MNIKNYTSTVSVEKTLARIEARLAAAGASGIMKNYNERKEVCAMVFEIRLGERSHYIRVPANVEACGEAMWNEYCLSHTRPNPDAKARIREQAQRTAWKLVQDWIDVQISMIVMKQAEFLEVFLPYIWDGKTTYFASIKTAGFKQLPDRTAE